MNKLYIFRGLPGSGKTTAARSLQKRAGGVLVGRDHLRFALYGIYHDPDFIDQSMVAKIQDETTRFNLRQGTNVFVDDMNLRNQYVKRLIKIANECGVPYTIVDMTDVSLATCLERDAHRDRSVGAEVITKLHARFIKGKPHPLPVPQVETLDLSVFERYEHVSGLPWAIVCDIDGTIAHTIDRSPYDESLVITDSVDTAVRSIVETTNLDVIFLSGRRESCREQTEEWLREHVSVSYELFMRRVPEDEGRNDAIVKLELFDRHIRGKYNVLYVLDDRQRVVEAWNSIGLKVLQAHSYGRNLNF